MSEKSKTPSDRGPKGSPLVAVIMGSDSDAEALRPCLDTLTEFGIPYEVRVISAHRTPDAAHEYARAAADRGLVCLIAAAGGAAHLAGVLASLTPLPVIGIPIKTSSLGGIDSLLSTVQMPAGVPVATVAIGKAGPVNAAILAAQILALADAGLRKKLVAYKARLADRVAEADRNLSFDPSLDPSLDPEALDGEALDGEALDGEALDGEALDGRKPDA